MKTEYYAVYYQRTIPAKKNIPSRKYWEKHCECDFLNEANEVIDQYLKGDIVKVVRVIEEIVLETVE